MLEQLDGNVSAPAERAQSGLQNEAWNLLSRDALTNHGARTEASGTLEFTNPFTNVKDTTNSEPELRMSKGDEVYAKEATAQSVPQLPRIQPAPTLIQPYTINRDGTISRGTTTSEGQGKR